MRVGTGERADAAITLLALTTDLRPYDIVALRLADIDWRGQMISIMQQKKGNPLTLPLPALVAARLAAYVLVSGPAWLMVTCSCARWLHTCGFLADHSSVRG